MLKAYTDLRKHQVSTWEINLLRFTDHLKIMFSLGEVLSSKTVEAGRKDGKSYLTHLTSASFFPLMSDFGYCWRCDTGADRIPSGPV